MRSTVLALVLSLLGCGSSTPSSSTPPTPVAIAPTIEVAPEHAQSAPEVVLDAPGEYDIGGVLVTGIATKRPDGTRNVVFICEIDGIRIGHLGLPATLAFEELKDVDVLLLPVGGGNSLQPNQAADLMTRIEPRIAIPMNYKAGGETLDLEPLEKFLKETGSKPEPQPRISVSRSSLPADLTVMVLEPKLLS